MNPNPESWGMYGYNYELSMSNQIGCRDFEVRLNRNPQKQTTNHKRCKAKIKAKNRRLRKQRRNQR